MNDIFNRTRWQVFVREFQRDLLVWVMSFAILAIFRLFMIGWFGSQMRVGDAGAQVLRAVLRGARFDSMVASYPIALCLPFTALCLFKDVSRVGRRVRIVVAITA